MQTAGGSAAGLAAGAAAATAGFEFGVVGVGVIALSLGGATGGSEVVVVVVVEEVVVVDEVGVGPLPTVEGEEGAADEVAGKPASKPPTSARMAPKVASAGPRRHGRRASRRRLTLNRSAMSTLRVNFDGKAPRPRMGRNVVPFEEQ